MDIEGQVDVNSLTYKSAKALAVTAFNLKYLRHQLKETGGNISAAARRAGLDRSNFKRMLKKAGIEASEFRKMQ